MEKKKKLKIKFEIWGRSIVFQVLEIVGFESFDEELLRDCGFENNIEFNVYSGGDEDYLVFDKKGEDLDVNAICFKNPKAARTMLVNVLKDINVLFDNLKKEELKTEFKRFEKVEFRSKSTSFYSIGWFLDKVKFLDTSAQWINSYKVLVSTEGLGNYEVIDAYDIFNIKIPKNNFVQEANIYTWEEL